MRALRSIGMVSVVIGWISVGLDRMQRNFEPMRRQAEAWLRSELTDVNVRWHLLSGRTAQREEHVPLVLALVMGTLTGLAVVTFILLAERMGNAAVADLETPIDRAV